MPIGMESANPQRVLGKPWKHVQLWGMRERSVMRKWDEVIRNYRGSGYGSRDSRYR